MKKVSNILLIYAIVIPVVLLFWPFAKWNDAMSLILRVISSIAVQILFCRVGRWNAIKIIPTVLTGACAAWGTYLYITSPHWVNATFWGSLVADYISPFICCIVVFVAWIWIKKK